MFLSLFVPYITHLQIHRHVQQVNDHFVSFPIFSVNQRADDLKCKLCNLELQAAALFSCLFAISLGPRCSLKNTYLLARPLGALQSQMDKAQWIKTRPQHRELRALLFTISVWVL